MYHMNCGVICDTYIFRKALAFIWKKTNLYFAKVFELGLLEKYIFLTNPVKIQNMQFHRDVVTGYTRKKIVFLGYFLSSHDPITDALANKQFFEYMKIVANKFSDSSIFIRMKHLDSKLYQSMLNESDTFNVYISTDYDSAGESYALCRNADAIVSLKRL